MFLMKHLYLDVGINVNEHLAVKGSSNVKLYLLFSAVSAGTILVTMNLSSQQRKEIPTASYWE